RPSRSPRRNAAPSSGLPPGPRITGLSIAGLGVPAVGCSLGVAACAKFDLPQGASASKKSCLTHGSPFAVNGLSLDSTPCDPGELHARPQGNRSKTRAAASKPSAFQENPAAAHPKGAPEERNRGLGLFRYRQAQAS